MLLKYFCVTKEHNIFLLSVQFSRSVVSDSLWPHELQHARPPCPSPIPGVHSNSRPSSRWCHPAISSSVKTIILAFTLSIIIIWISNYYFCVCVTWGRICRLFPYIYLLVLTQFELHWHICCGAISILLSLSLIYLSIVE